MSSSHPLRTGSLSEISRCFRFRSATSRGFIICGSAGTGFPRIRQQVRRANQEHSFGEELLRSDLRAVGGVGTGILLHLRGSIVCLLDAGGVGTLVREKKTERNHPNNSYMHGLFLVLPCRLLA